MKTTRLILVGGFLGAGKTTLLLEMSQRLTRKGQCVGLITNDQAPELVDTAFLSRGDINVAEVSGSCFCCNFQGLLDAMSKLRKEAEADLLVAEPVGSCTDLSATIVQPLKELMGRDMVLGPLTVMADPARLTDILDGGTSGLHVSAAYIFRKQLEEADIIVISKTDMLGQSELTALKEKLSRTYPAAEMFALSAKTGDGFDAWFAAVTSSSNSGRRIAEVDYDVYAEGEAVLGWLNCTVMLRSEGPTDWSSYAESFLGGLGEKFDRLKASVGHVKLIIETDGSFLMGNMTGKADTLNISGKANAGTKARMTLNARVQMSPETLDDIVHKELGRSTRGRLKVTNVAWRCLSPGRPNPTHRYGQVVGVRQK